MARAGVSYVVGREDNATYGETWNGVHMRPTHQFPDGVDPYVIEGDSTSGLLWGISDGTLAAEGSGDDKVQAYNFRICLTDVAENSIPIECPADYDSTRNELLLRLNKANDKKQSAQPPFSRLRARFCYIDQFPLLGRKHRNIACGYSVLWYNYFVEL